MSTVEQVFTECERARADGVLIRKVSATDKEYHFQNWVRDRLDALGIRYHTPGRNTYPDFRIIDNPEGYEAKGLAWPGRESDYDANSQVPAGVHDGRQVFYIFGRYPTDLLSDVDEYPVTDLIVCHGSFLNADSAYVHENKSFRGFGAYGDILVRDRKMYVVPTPFSLLNGATGLATLILPDSHEPSTENLVPVGEVERIEADQVVTSYEFDLQANSLVANKQANPHAEAVHRFRAYRSRGHGDQKKVSAAT